MFTLLCLSLIHTPISAHCHWLSTLIRSRLAPGFPTCTSDRSRLNGRLLLDRLTHMGWMSDMFYWTSRCLPTFSPCVWDLSLILPCLRPPPSLTLSWISFFFKDFFGLQNRTSTFLAWPRMTFALLGPRPRCATVLWVLQSPAPHLCFPAHTQK